MTAATEELEIEDIAVVTQSFDSEQRVKMTYEEFAAHVSDVHAEWADGEVIFFMPPLPLHQRLLVFLTRLISFYTDAFDLGEVLVAPLEMRIKPNGNAREPDVLFIAHANAARLDKRRLNGPADLVIEIISTESIDRDRGAKFYEYQEGGVREYWIIDPRPGKERIDVYALNAEGRYQAVLPDAEGRYQATVLPGFWFRAEWLRENGIPELLPTLAAILPREARAALAQKLGL